MTAAELRRYAAGLKEGIHGPAPDLAAFLGDVADAMDVPMELIRLDAKPRKSGEGVITLRGPVANVRGVGRNGCLYRQVAILVIGGDE